MVELKKRIRGAGRHTTDGRKRFTLTKPDLVSGLAFLSLHLVSNMSAHGANH